MPQFSLIAKEEELLWSHYSEAIYCICFDEHVEQVFRNITLSPFSNDSIISGIVKKIIVSMLEIGNFVFMILTSILLWFYKRFHSSHKLLGTEKTQLLYHNCRWRQHPLLEVWGHIYMLTQKKVLFFLNMDKLEQLSGKSVAQPHYIHTQKHVDPTLNSHVSCSHVSFEFIWSVIDEISDESVSITALK